MNKSEDPDGPKNQRLDQAPHGGRNLAGDIVSDSIESSGQGSVWDASGDLTPENADETGVEGYDSGPGTYQSIPEVESANPTVPAPKP